MTTCFQVSGNDFLHVASIDCVSFDILTINTTRYVAIVLICHVFNVNGFTDS